MNILIWLLIGCGLVALTLVARLIYRKILHRKIVQIGSRWERAVSSHKLVKYMSLVFFVSGVAIILASSGMFIHHRLRPLLLPKEPQLVVVRKDNELSAAEIFRLVNAERRVRNLSELVIDPGLQAVAEERARDMAENKYYSHRNLEGRFFYDLFSQHGFSTGYACENLSIEFTTDEMAYFTSWLNSKRGHRECLLNKDVTRAGYAVISFQDPATDGSTAKSYIAVGIHAAPPFTKQASTTR